VTNTALSALIARTGLRFSPDPSSQTASTIGGNAATNAGGINTLKHGVTTHHILGFEAVLADGSIVRSRTQGLDDGFSADLPALFCGSEGVLGVFSRLWCRLTPVPGSVGTVLAIFNSPADACRTVRDVIAAGITPTSMEMMDGRMIQVVEEAFSLGLPPDAEALLLIEVDGVDEVVDEQLERIRETAGRRDVRELQHCADPARRAELWRARKSAFGAIGRISPSYCTQDACVPRSRLPEVIDAVAAIGREFGLTISNVFHAGDGNIHPVLLFDEDDPDDVQRVLAASERILRYCVEVGGTITGEHGVGVEKLHLMSALFSPETLEALRDVKLSLDPEARLNDAKLIPSDRLEIDLHDRTRAPATNNPGGALASP
jgi:glycolate oxidase